MNTTTTGSHIKKKKQGFWEEVSWQFFMIKVRYWNWSFAVKKKILRALFCKRGYHKTIADGVEVSTSLKNSKGMRCVLKVRWLECQNCKTRFFANAKDKKKYLNYKEREQKNWGKVFDAMSRRRKCEKK